MNGCRLLLPLISLVSVTAGCAKKEASESSDANAPAMAPAPAAMDTDRMRMDTTAYQRAMRDNSGNVRVVVPASRPIIVDGIQTHVPKDSIITLGNGTHHVQCQGHDTVITVDNHPRSAPATVDCRTP